jgi:trehalose transport system substrate-binding protein
VVPPKLLTSLLPLVEYEDKICFVPFRPNVKIAFYNKQKFDQYGLKPPQTWEQLREVARVFYEKEGVGRVAIQGSPGPASAVTVFEFVKAAGGDPLTLDGDGSKDAFEFLRRLEPYLADEYEETRFDTANELLISDVVYLLSNWTYGIKVVIEDAGKTEVEVYSGWEGPQREVHVLGGDVLAVPKGAHHKEKAIELIKLLLEIETQQELLFRLRWPPAIIDAYVEIPPDLEPPYFQYVQKALGFAVLRSTSPQWTMVESVLDGAFGEVVREGKDISTLDKYRDMLKNIPSEYSRYTVEPEDTLDVIARRHNITVDFLAKANGITPQTVVYPGQILLVPKQ